MSTDNLRIKKSFCVKLMSKWSILLDRIKEYKLKIKGVSLHSLQIGTTHITIAYVNVVNSFHCQSSSFVMNTMPNLQISNLFVSRESSNLFYLVIIFDNTLVDSNQQHQTFAAYEM